MFVFVLIKPKMTSLKGQSKDTRGEKCFEKLESAESIAVKGTEIHGVLSKIAKKKCSRPKFSLGLM